MWQRCLAVGFQQYYSVGIMQRASHCADSRRFRCVKLIFYLENKREYPLLYVKVFGYEGFLSSVILLCVGSILINASNNIFPIFLQNVQGFSTTQAAFIMLPGPLFIMFLVPLMGEIL